MAHKWGRNIVEFGVGSAGATMCSRKRDGSGQIVTNGSLLSPAHFTIWLPLGDNQPYDSFTFLKSIFAPLNFPYGIDVEPDEPV